MTMTNVLTVSNKNSVIKTQGIIFIDLGHTTVSNDTGTKKPVSWFPFLVIRQCNSELTKLHVPVINSENEKLIFSFKHNLF